MWLIYTFIGVIAYSVYYTLSRYYLKQKNSDAVIYAILFSLICSIIISIGVMLVGYKSIDFSRYYPNIILMGILYSLAQVLVFKASKLIEASEVIIISSTRVLWTIGAAMIFLGETFTLQKSIGVILILISVVIVSYQKHPKNRSINNTNLKKGRLYAALTGMFLGIGFVNDAYILNGTDSYSYAALVFILPTIIISLVYRPSFNKIQKQLNKPVITGSIVLGIFYCIGVVASYAAFQNGGNASQIVPIGQSVVIITVLLSIVFFKDRQRIKIKILAAILVSIGVMLIK